MSVDESLAAYRLLDLCCGGGGASVGYARAGFEVRGVDAAEQPDYPYEFEVGDALTWPLVGYDVVVASPPCQRYSRITPAHARDRWPDLVGPLRDRLRAAVLAGEISGYVIENVPGAPLRDPVTVCGSAFGLAVQRHRLFESSFVLAGTGCAHVGDPVPVYGSVPAVGVAAAREAMGIGWLPWSRLVEAIPPAYTEFLGRQVIRHLGRGRSVGELEVVPSAWSRSFRRFVQVASVAVGDRDSSSGSVAVGRPVSSLSPARFCLVCGEPVEAAATGRIRRYCSQVCRQAAFRERRRSR